MYFYKGAIAVFIPQLSTTARFRPLTTKTIILVFELLQQGQLHPSSDVALHVNMLTRRSVSCYSYMTSSLQPPPTSTQHFVLGAITDGGRKTNSRSTRGERDKILKVERVFTIIS